MCIFDILSFIVISSVDTDKDIAFLHLDIKPKVDGTFWYRLNNKTFQQCTSVTAVACLHRKVLLYFTGPSDNILQELLADTYRITFKFIPTNSPEAYSISEECRFEIKPTGY